MATTASSPDDKNISSKDNTKSDISQNNDNDEHGTMRVVRSGSTSQENNKLLASGENYFSIHFSGCGECTYRSQTTNKIKKNLLPDLSVLNSLDNRFHVALSLWRCCSLERFQCFVQQSESAHVDFFFS
jgi:hypothetical protein